MNKDEREAILRGKLIAMQEYEEQLRAQGVGYIGGVDEVGRGPFAGPVVAACVVLPEDFDVLGIDDSKKVPERRREALFDEILKKALAWGIGMRDNDVIDKINILEATKEAMVDAVKSADAMLTERLGVRARDGDGGERACGASSASGASGALGAVQHLLIDALALTEVKIPQTAINKGDSKSLSIAAASIVAKVTRDRMMLEYHDKYPEYGFASHKGYGTAAHKKAISSYGPTPIHRMSFLRNMERAGELPKCRSTEMKDEKETK